MKKYTLRSFLVAGICCAYFGNAQAEGDAEAGMKKFYTCTGCHAIPGYTNVYPMYHVPRLGGQHPEYVVAALTAYKAGDRSHPTMIANASTLNEQDMADIGAYVAGLDKNPETGPVWGDADAGKKLAAEVCQACHGTDGNSSDPNYPRLAGQYEDYMTKALEDYKAGNRKNAIMSGMVANLSEQDMADLSAYYASQPPVLSTIDE